MKELKQREIAEKIGISRTYLNGILRGRRTPSVKLARKICKMTGMDFFDLRPELKKIIREFL